MQTLRQDVAFLVCLPYALFGTTVDYTYNVYKFYEHTVSELEKFNNPFAAAIIAGKYAKRYKKDTEQRLHFKIKLMKQVIRNFPLDQGKSRLYITALFYFIDYLLQTPGEYEEELRNEITNSLKKDGGQQMHAEKEILSPTLAGVLKMLEQEEIVKAKEKGKSEAKVSFTVELIKDGFQDEKNVQLTKLELQEVIELKNSLLD